MGNIIAYNNEVLGMYDTAHKYYTRLQVYSLTKKNKTNIINVNAETVTLRTNDKISNIATSYQLVEVPVTPEWVKQYHLTVLLWGIVFFLIIATVATTLGLALTFGLVWLALFTLFIIVFVLNFYITKLELNLYEEYINFLQNDINLLFIAENNAQIYRDYEAILNDNKESDIENIADKVVELLLYNLKKEGLQKDFWRNL